MILKNIKYKILRLNYKVQDFWKNVVFKFVKTDKFGNLEEILNLVSSPDKFFETVNDPKSLYGFVANLSKLYAKSFGLTITPKVKYNTIDFLGKDENIGFAIRSYFCISPLYFKEFERLVKNGSEEEKLNFIFKICGTTIHETTHIFQFYIEKKMFNGKPLPNMKGDKNVLDQLIFSAYIHTLIKCLDKLYKSKEESLQFINLMLHAKDWCNIMVGKATFEDKIDLEKDKYYGNNPSEVSARISAINFLKQMTEKQPKYKRLLEEEKTGNTVWISNGGTDLYDVILLPCQEYIMQGIWIQNCFQKSVASLQLLGKIFQGFKDFCSNDEKFYNIHRLIVMAEEESSGKYSHFSLDFHEKMLKDGLISQEEFDKFNKDKNLHEQTKANAVKLANYAFSDKG